jgi:hypothetical protein
MATLGQIDRQRQANGPAPTTTTGWRAESAAPYPDRDGGDSRTE